MNANEYLVLRRKKKLNEMNDWSDICWNQAIDLLVNFTRKINVNLFLLVYSLKKCDQWYYTQHLWTKSKNRWIFSSSWLVFCLTLKYFEQKKNYYYNGNSCYSCCYYNLHLGPYVSIKIVFFFHFFSFLEHSTYIRYRCFECIHLKHCICLTHSIVVNLFDDPTKNIFFYWFLIISVFFSLLTSSL